MQIHWHNSLVFHLKVSHFKRYFIKNLITNISWRKINISYKRQTSFTILDPASGVPSDGTPRLQASLTSRHSAAALMLQNLQFTLSPAPAANMIPSKSLQFMGNPSPIHQMLIGNDHNSTFPVSSFYNITDLTHYLEYNIIFYYF